MRCVRKMWWFLGVLGVCLGFRKDLESSRPNMVYILMDDLGYHDVGFTPLAEPREKILEATPYITKLAKEEGVILTRHYAHSHCSPSRRSFLTGRWTIHAGGDALSHVGDDDLDLRMEWISERLKRANYSNYMVGKSHTGFKSAFQLPTFKGFDKFVGILEGQSQYYNYKYWKNITGGKTKTTVYNTLFWGRNAREMISDHILDLNLSDDPEENIAKSKEKPFFLSLNLQTPHTPIEPPSKTHSSYKSFTKKQAHPYEYMIYSADVEIRETIELIKEHPSVWENTLIVFSSDNGGTSKLIRVKSGFNSKTSTTRGSNFPLRGEKSTSFEGGFRVPAFIAGGFLPDRLKGTTNGVISHISDWFSTFAHLAGVSVDKAEANFIEEVIKGADLENQVVHHHQNPYILQQDSKINVWEYLTQTIAPEPGSKYEYGLFPPIDSVNLAPYLFSDVATSNNEFHPSERTDRKLILSTEAMILGKYKFILAQPCGLTIQYDGTYSCKPNREMYGWRMEDSISYINHSTSLGCTKMALPTEEGRLFSPCVFDMEEDKEERYPIEDEDLINELWETFNQSMTFKYDRLLVNKEPGVTPLELMNCDTAAYKYSRKTLFGTSDAPKCDKDQCTRVKIDGVKQTVCNSYNSVYNF